MMIIKFSSFIDHCIDYECEDFTFLISSSIESMRVYITFYCCSFSFDFYDAELDTVNHLIRSNGSVLFLDKKTYAGIVNMFDENYDTNFIPSILMGKSS